MQDLHPLADVARELGRFEMTVNPARPSVSYVKSELSLADFAEYGFARAASIIATQGSYLPGLKPATLARLGRKVAGGWALHPPAPGTTAQWRRLLESDMPLVFEAPADPAWLEHVIARLHQPMLYLNENMALSSEAFRVCRRLLKPVDDKVLVACGLYRQSVSFFGKGPSFEVALAAMARRPQAMWGLDDAGRSALRRGAFRLFPRKRAAGVDA